MDDDFNTANAITVLFDLAKEANLYLNENHTDIESLKHFKNNQNITRVLGIND